jgi:hypothetical protein
MSTIFDLKPRFQHLLRPLTRALHRLGVTANSITLTATGASILYGGWMLMEPTRPTAFLLLPLFMLVRMALNVIDGMIAVGVFHSWPQVTPAYRSEHFLQKRVERNGSTFAAVKYDMVIGSCGCGATSVFLVPLRSAR